MYILFETGLIIFQVQWIVTDSSAMVKTKDNEAARQRIIKQKQKREFDKYTAFYAYVMTLDPEIVRSFEAKHPYPFKFNYVKS